MPLNPDRFRQSPDVAREFSRGPDGAILRAVAFATAATNLTLVSGHFILGGPAGREADFVIAPAYQEAFDNEETSLLAALAPFLIEHQILGQADHEAYRQVIARAARAFGMNELIDDPVELGRRIRNIFSTGENRKRFERLVSLSSQGFCIVRRAANSRAYILQEYAVIPSTILPTLCRPGWNDYIKARFTTRPKKARLHALQRHLTLIGEEPFPRAARE